MADAYASHFGINNIPYGIASSSKRSQPQAATRIGDDVIFLGELTKHDSFKSIVADLASLFSQTTLNAFASQSTDIHSAVRAAIRDAHHNNLHTSASENIKDVTLHLPVAIGDFTDYSASANHVLNAGEAITGVRSFPPAFHKYPVGYAGRCSSIAVSGTSITRPLGQYIEDYAAAEKNVIFGASRALDYELEIGAIIGRPVEPGTYLNARDADAHIFGFVLVNDWSARDIQGLEMNPLGPFNGKNFGTSISPWVITLEALKAHEVPAPERMGAVAPFMDDPKSVNYDINLTGSIRRNGASTTTCTVGFETMYWTFRHMLAHHTIGGCGLRTGDLIASGTVSGEKEHEHGCLLELTKNGKKASKLSDGGELRFLADGDEVTYEAIIGDGSAGVGFGACVGVVKPARQL
ncbi:Fumarylacetoacetase [Ascochyta rabiei]|uniref:Fumarylacetoacetase n=1 Tax=Didymella rabiei TaxID=5454 RepID=A0A162Y2U9_DIDRA|nr:Fumarylacetoacetase [Ascochyta rabiei]KZM19800.1 fumarylacetoacetase [Ascochyta rabiei]UPX13486.1 Fumarylacetoacetase [Ascochyta rabiei]